MNMRVLKTQSVMPRVDGILRDVEKLRRIGTLPFDQFAAGEEHIVFAQFYLRQALEGIFHIGTHILARLNGGRSTEYKDIAKRLGEHGIVEKEFAERNLVAMAGYRNRLTHFYAEVTPKELHTILQKNLNDFEVFLSAVKNVFEHPERFGLRVE